MVPAGDIFRETVQTILRRFCAQNSLVSPPESSLRDLAGRLWRLVEERGLPPPLAPGDNGRPGDLPDGECAPLMLQVLAEVSPADRDRLATPVRQLVKACFHPEFKVCRDSFREVSPDGSCRRQQLSRVRGRISGTHCIDCPHWVALAAEAHAAYLQQEWLLAGRPELAGNAAVFLPEDFRRLRHLLYEKARGRI